MGGCYPAHVIEVCIADLKPYPLSAAASYARTAVHAPAKEKHKREEPVRGSGSAASADWQPGVQRTGTKQPASAVDSVPQQEGHKP